MSQGFCVYVCSLFSRVYCIVDQKLLYKVTPKKLRFLTVAMICINFVPKIWITSFFRNCESTLNICLYLSYEIDLVYLDENERNTKG